MLQKIGLGIAVTGVLVALFAWIGHRNRQTWKEFSREQAGVRSVGFGYGECGHVQCNRFAGGGQDAWEFLCREGAWVTAGWLLQDPDGDGRVDRIHRWRDGVFIELLMRSADGAQRAVDFEHADRELGTCAERFVESSGPEDADDG